MGTVHNEAEMGDIAKTVLMCGDPLRAKAIAETYLEEYRLVNQIREMYAYTGKYHGKEITVMAHGMGMPSVGIYAYELYHFYGVERIIRLGTCGALKESMQLLDIVLVERSYTESNYAYTLNNEHVNVAEASIALTKLLEESAQKKKIPVVKGTVVSSDCFDWYMTDLSQYLERIPKELDVLVNEMESFAIFYIAKMLHKEAACLLTVVDSHYTQNEPTEVERRSIIEKMTLIALEACLKV